MAVFSNIQIKQAIDGGHIVCYPFDPKRVAHASLDVTLGYYYYRIARLNERPLYNPLDKAEVERYFDGPYRAMTHQQWCDQNGLQPLSNIPLDHPVISLGPNERILAHSHEFIGIKPPGAYELKPRSSWGRSGIAVGLGASWVDPGYINRLTLDIYNLNAWETVLLPVGEHIAQAVFMETGEIAGNYGEDRGDGVSGKYQQGTDLDNIIKMWSPDTMLPKSYLDQRSMPPKVEGLSYD